MADLHTCTADRAKACSAGTSSIVTGQMCTCVAERTEHPVQCASNLVELSVIACNSSMYNAHV